MNGEKRKPSRNWKQRCEALTAEVDRLTRAVHALTLTIEHLRDGTHLRDHMIALYRDMVAGTQGLVRPTTAPVTPPQRRRRGVPGAGGDCDGGEAEGLRYEGEWMRRV